VTPDDPTDDVVYVLGPTDDLVEVGGGWDDFARREGAPGLADGRVLGQSLWAFVRDRTTRTLYRDLLARVRSGRVVEFPLRCDSPDCRRWMSMRVRPLSGSQVEFRARVVRQEARPPAPVAEAAPESGRLVRACGWCRRVDAGGEWVEVEEAVARLGVFDRPSGPPLTHGICPGCLAGMHALLGSE
jgi:hypothetical protein